VRGATSQRIQERPGLSSPMAKKKIEIRSMTIKQALQRIDEGHFAIPKLQREFVWDGNKSAKLFDSILANMPIGVVMIWETPKSHRLYLRQKYHILPPFNQKNKKVWFIIDGQQRLSVLHHVRDGNTVRNAKGADVKFDRIVFALEKEKDSQQIRYRKKLMGHYETLFDILHPEWKFRLSHLNKKQKERIKFARDRILRYPMHLMFVQADINEIRESFLRINTQGVKISSADAIFSKAEGLDLRDIRHEIRECIDKSFGQIPEMPILFSMAAVRGATEARGSALQQVINKLEKEAKADLKLRKALTQDWNRLVVCFGKAVDYLRQNFTVLNREFLYSDYIIAVLALFYFWNGRGPSATQKDQICKWYWTTTVGSRYSGVNFLRCIPHDIEFFQRLAANPASKFNYEAHVEKGEVRRSQFSSRSGITCAIYNLLLSRHPVSIMDDGLNKIPLDRYSTSANRKDRHHIFPRGPLRKLEIPPNRYNSIVNICLLTGEENQQIGSRRPSLYLKELRSNGKYFNQKMSRHLIPAGDKSGVWMTDLKRGFNTFLRERTDSICHALENEAGIKLFRKDG
jgi:hypothetical protein